MTIDFIPPTLQVLEDQRVTPDEISWLTQELLLVIIVAVMMTAFWNMIEEGIEW
jgi:hypothetical protein